MKALEMGAVETLILWENLDVGRFTLKDRDSEETSVCSSVGLRPSLSLCLDVTPLSGSHMLQVKHLRPEQEKDKKNFTNPVVRSVCTSASNECIWRSIVMFSQQTDWRRLGDCGEDCTD